jgi:flagellar protein FlaH
MVRDVFLIELEQDGLHNQLAKGLPKGAIVLIVGEHGSGKSAVSLRFIYSFLRHNYTVTLISTELTTKGFIDQMSSLGYPILDYLLEKRILFIPVFPLIGKILPRHDFLTRLLAQKALYDTDIIVVDTFSALVKEEINTEKAYMAIAFFKKLAGKSKTLILTVDPTELSGRLLMPFQSVADVYLTLKTRPVGGTIEHIMYVNRFGGASGQVGRTIGFRVEAGAGFIVDITAVA